MRHASIQADPLSKHASAEERVWASARLGNAALLMAGLFGAWWLLITAVITVNAPPELRQWRFGTLEHWVDVVLAASFVVFGLALRFGRPTRPSLLLGADFVYAVGACLGAAWHGWSWSLTQPPLQSYILIATYALVLRAALLPGPPKRTLMVTVRAYRWCLRSRMATSCAWRAMRARTSSGFQGSVCRWRFT